MTMRPGRIFITAGIICCFFISTGCAQRMQSVKEDQLTAENRFATLRSVSVSTDAFHVEISADRPLTYTSYKTSTPPKAVIDLAQIEPGATITPVEYNKGAVKRIEIIRHQSGENVLSRVEITLNHNEDFSVHPDPLDKGKLLIDFKQQAVDEKEQKVKAKAEDKLIKAEDVAPVPVAGLPDKIPQDGTRAEASDSAVGAEPNREGSARYNAVKGEDEVAEKAGTPLQKNGTPVLTAVRGEADCIDVSIAGGLTSFNSFKLSDPARLVIDVFGVKNGVAAKTVVVNSLGFGKARLGTSPDKVRIVLDAVKKEVLPFQVVKTTTGLKIVAKGSAVGRRGTAGEMSKEAVSAHQAKATPEGSSAAATSVPAASRVAAAVSAPAATKAVEDAPHQSKPKLSSVEAIDFKNVGDYAQLAIKVSGECTADQPRKVAAGWALTLNNCQVPRKLQRMLDTSAFASAVKEITPYQVKVRHGYDAKVLVKLRSEAPFKFRREGNVYLWEIKNPEKELQQGALPLGPNLLSQVVEAKAPMAQTSVVAQKVKVVPNLERDLITEKSNALAKKKVFSGRRVTLEFSDADVRKIFQLIAEVSNLNFLIADDVTGTISLKLVNVPWDQALDVILDTKGLEERQEGNILYIKPKGKFRTADQEEAALREEREKRMDLTTKLFDVNFAALADVAAQFDKLRSSRGTISQDSRTNRLIVTDNTERLDRMATLLRQLDVPEKQVMIEARIVEATSTFTRDLGIQWGLHYRDGSASIFGINQLDTGFGGDVTTTVPSAGTSGQGNPGAAMGMSFGKLTSNVQLDLRLSAAATSGQIKIISTPKVVTLNNKMARISQGQMIPYSTVSAEGTKTEFVQAVLSLDVTPHVSADGSIGMKVKATNNSAGAAPAGITPPINMKEATTELQVLDGETTVIGGIYVDNDTESYSGVPYLMDIPLLGWLFKSNTKQKTKTELLIFITPRIVS